MITTEGQQQERMRQGRSMVDSQRRSAALWSRLTRGRGPLALADQMIVSASNFATGVVLVRGLGLSEFGKYSIAFALLLYANSLQMNFIASPMLSIAPLLPNEQKSHFVNGMLALQVLASFLLFAIFGVAGLTAHLFTSYYSVPGILLFACCVGTYQLQDWLRRYYFLVNKGKLAIATDFISYSGQLAVLFSLWRLGRLTLVLTFLVMCATSVAALVMGPMTDRIRPDFGRLRQTWERCKKLSHGLLIAGQVRWFGSQGVLLIGVGIVGSSGIGGLRATQSMAGPLFLLLMSLENFVPVRLSEELRSNGVDGAFQFLRRLILGGALFSVLVMVPIAVFGRTILRVVYGPMLVQFYWPMLLQLTTILIASAATLFFHFYRSVEDIRPTVWANALAATVNVLTVYSLGHLWGASGIVLSGLFGQLTIVAFCGIYWMRHQTTIQNCYLPVARKPALDGPIETDLPSSEGV